MAVPFILAGLVLIVARALGGGRSVRMAQACAIVLALSATYVLAFGMPADLVFNARLKIILSALGGLVACIALERGTRWARCSLLAGAIGIPIWVGMPALADFRAESALLILPIAAALTVPSLIDGAPSSDRAPRVLIALTMAVGLAAIAVLAKVFSLAELCLSLTSALLAILMISRQQLAAPAVVTTTAALSALFTALLLYSEASLLALFVLGTVIGAKRLATLTSGEKGTKATTRHTLVFCVLPAAAAILIARIDAGPFSLY